MAKSPSVLDRIRRFFARSGSDTFISLVLVAEEDPIVRRALLDLVDLPPSERLRALDILLYRMRGEGASKDFLDAMALLTEDEVVERLRIALREPSPG